jgi:hypothetical protein
VLDYSHVLRGHPCDPRSVLLFHVTDTPGRNGIDAVGFAISYTADTPGEAWLTDNRDALTAASANATKAQEWWVVVDLPDDVAEAYRWVDDLFSIPFEVVNRYRPFTFAAFS